MEDTRPREKVWALFVKRLKVPYRPVIMVAQRLIQYEESKHKHF